MRGFVEEHILNQSLNEYRDALVGIFNTGTSQKRFSWMGFTSMEKTVCIDGSSSHALPRYLRSLRVMVPYVRGEIDC